MAFLSFLLDFGCDFFSVKTMMPQEYYVDEMGEITGPYALRTLQQLAIKNRLEMMCGKHISYKQLINN